MINENDTVATTEIRYGDNDRLAARVAQMISADCLLLLSDVAGLYTADPNLDPAARLIPEIREITAEIEAMGGRSASAVGSGGMATKIAAARIATSAAAPWRSPPARHASCEPAGRGRRLQLVPARFQSRERAQAMDSGFAAPQWRDQHRCRCPAGAAFWQKPAACGVTTVIGRFERGDTVSVLDREGAEIARGMIAYNDRDAGRLVGKRSADIEACSASAVVPR